VQIIYRIVSYRMVNLFKFYCFSSGEIPPECTALNYAIRVHAKYTLLNALEVF